MSSYLKKGICTGLLVAACFDMAVGQEVAPVVPAQRLKQLRQEKEYLKDTAYANTLNTVAFLYADTYPDSAILLLQGQAERCRSLGFREGEADVYDILGNAYQTKGDFKRSMEYYEQSYQLAKKIGYQRGLPVVANNIGVLFLNQGNYPMALARFYEGLVAAEAVKNDLLVGTILNNIATIHFFQNKLKEADNDYRKILAIAKRISDTTGMLFAYNNIGEVDLEQDSVTNALQDLDTAYRLAVLTNNTQIKVVATINIGIGWYKRDSLSKAVSYFRNAISLAKETGNVTSTCKALIWLAKARNKEGAHQEALGSALEGEELARKIGQTQLSRDASEITSAIYEALGKGDSALSHFKLFKIASDSINNSEAQRAAATYKAEYEFSKKELEFRRKDLQQRWFIFSAIAALVSLSVIIWVVNRNRRHLDVANKKLHQKNIVIETEKSRVEEALTRLKTAQAQLVQSEKMASLGELTAGIAHEIQNPLNFVNNFSELNKELLQELEAEVTNGRQDEVKAIMLDLVQNEEKINYHGKRADGIVKAMLQHSRTGSGVKELTDINVLAAESLQLAFHGLRGKDKSFNAEMQMDFDRTIGQVKLIPQDIGRVLLNLYNNAFYAVHEKRKATPGPYQPLVSVRTRRVGDRILITVRDNGNGVPQKIIEKIFQPFFTTKPTGEGTGLGLSLSYDIVTKGHGGSLSAVSEEGAGTEFTIELPTV